MQATATLPKLPRIHLSLLLVQHARTRALSYKMPKGGELAHPHQSLSGTLNSVRSIQGHFNISAALRSLPGFEPVLAAAVHLERCLQLLPPTAAAQPSADTVLGLATGAKSLDDILHTLSEETKLGRGYGEPTPRQQMQDEVPAIMKDILQTFLRWAPDWLDDKETHILREDLNKLPECKPPPEKGGQGTRGNIIQNHNNDRGTQFVNSGSGGQYNYTTTAYVYQDAVNNYGPSRG